MVLQRNDLHRHLGRAPALYDEVAKRVDEVPAVLAFEEGSWCKSVRVRERVTNIKFLLEVPAASGAGELPIERLQFDPLWRELVLVALKELERNFWVQLFEDGHTVTVEGRQRVVNLVGGMA